MLKKIAIIVAATILFVSCASQKMWYGDAKKGFQLKHRFAPTDSSVYLTHVTIQDSMKLMGKVSRSRTDIKSQISQFVSTAQPEKLYLLSNGYHNFDITSNSPTIVPILPTIQDAMKSFLQARFTSELSSTGELRIITAVDSLLPPRLQPLIDHIETLSLIFPVFSEKGVKVGESWQVSRSHRRKTADFYISISKLIKYTIQEIAVHNQEEVLKIHLQGQYDFQGRERQLNIMAKSVGKGEINGEFLFAHQRGKFIEGSFSQLVTMNYSFPGIENVPVIRTIKLKTGITSQ